MKIKPTVARVRFRRWWRRQRRPDAEEQERQRGRILFVERHILWPIKLVVMFLSYFLWRQLIQPGEGSFSPEVSPEAARYATSLFGFELVMYLVGNLVFAMPLILAFQVHFRPSVVRWCAFFSAVLDSLFLSALIHITGLVNPETVTGAVSSISGTPTAGLNNVLYWIYCGIMVRNAIYFPVIYQQALINLSVVGSYTLALFWAAEDTSFVHTELFRLRITVLVLVGVCCWGIQMLLERQRRRELDQREHMLRTEKMRATGHLAAEVAHQLKNPLGIINNAAFNLQRSVERGKPVAADTIQIIRHEVQRADRILTDLLNYSGVSEGNIESVDINQILEGVFSSRLPQGLETKITLQKELEEGLPLLYAQRRWLEECLLNLIVNAVEAMPDGGRLTVRTRSEASGWIHVEVEDTGPGISESERGKIFEPFYTTKKGGTGLGLSLVKNVAETYGGRVSVESTIGKGSRFIIELPVHTNHVE